MTHGSLSIAGVADRSNSRAFEAYVGMAAVGVLAGIATAVARTPLHLPGHKALFWVLPLLVARRFFQVRWGITLGVVATFLAATLSGGRFAGGSVFTLPLMVAAGLLLDVAADRSRTMARRRAALLMIALAGGAANAVCSVGLFLAWSQAEVLRPTAANLGWAAGTHALFGIAAGTCGAIILLGGSEASRNCANSSTT